MWEICISGSTRGEWVARRRHLLSYSTRRMYEWHDQEKNGLTRAGFSWKWRVINAPRVKSRSLARLR